MILETIIATCLFIIGYTLVCAFVDMITDFDDIHKEERYNSFDTLNHKSDNHS